jgi:pSer/pThr/pTyr-binding forkhead associated (FHA) protein
MVPKGTVIFREGDTDTCAYRLMSGRVEVYKESGPKRVVLARLGPGEYFGEMNLVMESARTASVQAIEPCVLRTITPESFNRLLGKNPKAVFPILRVLLERLRVMNVKYLAALEAQEAAGRGKLAPPAAALPKNTSLRPSTTGLRLLGQTPAAQQALGKEGVQIRTFPFRIGRKTSRATADALSLNDLYLPDGEPFQVSRNHCAIDLAPDGSYLVLDRGSTLGTVVNGERIGSTVRVFEAPLSAAQNTLVLGNSESPFRFQLSRAA